MSVSRLLITVYIQHSALYSIWIFLWMDGSAADSAMSCKQFSNPDTETTYGCFLLSRENRTWEESHTFCNGLGDGWSLVEIEDVETQKHVDNVTLTADVSTGSWIGLRRRNKHYTWESGNKLGYPGFFKQLAVGEVQSTGDCVTTSPPDDTSLYGIWSYMDCTARLYSICHSVLTPGSSLPPRKTTTSRRPTTSTMKQNATQAKPQMTVNYVTTQSTATTTKSTATTTMTTSSTTVLIAVSSAAAFVAAVFLVGGVIDLCRRNKQKRLRVRTNDDTESGTVADVRTKPEVEYAVVTKIQTKQPSQVHDCNTESGYHYASMDDGALPMKQGVNDQTYDTATITEKKQPITFDNTYARAMFCQSASDTGDDVYDHTRVTGKASQEVEASNLLRNKQKRLRVRTNDDTESGTVADVRTKPEVEYAVVTKIQTKQPSQVHDCNTESGYHYASVDDGALPMKQGVNDQTYDTATITEKKQPITFDNTYARAMFCQSASNTGDDVYDHTRVTGKASQEDDASHYDHAFFK